MDVQLSFDIVKPDHAAHIVFPHHNAGYGFHRNLLAVLGKNDFTIIVSRQAPRAVSGRLPFIHDHAEESAIIIGQITGAVLKPPHFPIVSHNTADIAVVSRSHAVVDAVGDCGRRIAVIFSHDAAHIAISDHITRIGRYRNSGCSRDRHPRVIGQTSRNAAHIVGAQNIAALPCAASGQLTVIPIANDAAHVLAQKHLLLPIHIVAVGIIAKTPGSAGAIADLHRISKPENPAEIPSLQFVFFVLMFISQSTQHQPVVGAVRDAGMGCAVAFRPGKADKIPSEEAADAAGKQISGHISLISAVLHPHVAPHGAIAEDPADTVLIFLRPLLRRLCPGRRRRQDSR